MLIIPDTNFLVYAAKFKLWHELERIAPRYSLLVLPQVVYELKALSKRKGKDKEAALLALESLRGLKIKAKKGNADKMIFQTACLLKNRGEKNFVVATMDKKLRAKLKSSGIKLLTIRQKRHLIID